MRKIDVNLMPPIPLVKHLLSVSNAPLTIKELYERFSQYNSDWSYVRFKCFISYLHDTGVINRADKGVYSV